ncbi:glutamate synthase [Pueribacillus theae]|uniref:Glutamate synthase n=1 Tax=Pueribacillus theae TaxID=2171751 RepID=A0A2U1K7F1_9BACI|nr:glutamate synthase subunit beta [Pueribacillus theae]PWA13144.1 glutamate synthase [Pueribacillus theae]
MGKVTGFMEYKRSPLRYRNPAERLKDWREVAYLPNEEILREQASRCMDCAVPFCQNGSTLSGMTTGCPVYNLIPEWNDLIYKGNWKEAYERLKMTNPFPEFTGRACPAPCEGGCVASLYESPVTIKNIERAIIDRAFEEGWAHPSPPAYHTGKKVAVIGSGPAGLACAAELNQKGHDVTVYERSDRIGGLLTYGIPKMKIEQHIVDRRVKLLAEEGVRFITGVEVGKHDAIEHLRSEYDAVVLCIGATLPRDLTIPGRGLQGIHFAMEYLHLNTKSLLDSNLDDGKYISAKGLDVIVIGGGDTATDCISTALRQDCKSLVQFDIYPQRPDQRRKGNPWPQYPIIHKLDFGQEEAMQRFGRDPRSFATSAVEFLGDETGRIVGVRSHSLNHHKEVIPDTEQVWPAQLVLLAIGFQGPEPQLPDKLNVQLNQRLTISTNSRSYQTNVEGVFSAGDARRGQSLIVWAIQEGKEAAEECHQYITGVSP